MNETQIIQGPIADVGAYDIDFKDGCLVAKVTAEHGAAAAAIEIKIDAAKVIDLIAAKIPGQVDDAVLGVIKAALVGA